MAFSPCPCARVKRIQMFAISIRSTDLGRETAGVGITTKGKINLTALDDIHTIWNNQTTSFYSIQKTQGNAYILNHMNSVLMSFAWCNQISIVINFIFCLLRSKSKWHPLYKNPINAIRRITQKIIHSYENNRASNNDWTKDNIKIWIWISF